MNKSDLIDYVANNSKTDLTKKQATEAVDLMWDGVATTLQAGDKVQLVGVITLEPTGRAARKGFNPQTGQEIEIQESMGVKAKPGKKLEDAVQGLDIQKFMKAKADKKAANASNKDKKKK